MTGMVSIKVQPDVDEQAMQSLATILTSDLQPQRLFSLGHGTGLAATQSPAGLLRPRQIVTATLLLPAHGFGLRMWFSCFLRVRGGSLIPQGMFGVVAVSS